MPTLETPTAQPKPEPTRHAYTCPYCKRGFQLELDAAQREAAAAYGINPPKCLVCAECRDSYNYKVDKTFNLKRDEPAAYAAAVSIGKRFDDDPVKVETLDRWELLANAYSEMPRQRVKLTHMLSVARRQTPEGAPTKKKAWD